MDSFRLILFFLCFIPLVSHANVDVSFSEPIVLSKDSDGFWRSNLGVEVKTNGLSTQRLKTSVALKAASAGKMVFRAAARATPYMAALNAAIEAYGYFFNKDSGQVLEKDRVVSHGDFESVSFMCDVGPQVGYYVANNSTYYGYSVFLDSEVTPSGNSIVINNCHSKKMIKYFVYKDVVKFGENREPIEYVSIPSNQLASPDRLGNLFLEEHLPLFQKIINDAVKSGSYEDDWPELRERINEIRKTFGVDSLENDNGIIPETSPESSDRSFCEWAPKMCSLADFFMNESVEPPIPDLPIKEVSPVKWSSGLPAGSCPSLPPITFQGQAVTYDLKDACWALSSVFKPILISLSLIGAAFILGGAKL